MYIERVPNRNSPSAVLLRESWREDGKVKKRTVANLSGPLERYGLDAPGARKLEKWTLDDIKATGLGGFVQLQLETLLDAIRESDALAKKIEKQVLAFTKPTEQYKRATTLPGFGVALGMTAVLESGDFKRFNPTIHAWYERKKKKSGVAKAKKALACKLAKAMWHVMNGKDFDEKLMFG